MQPALLVSSRSSSRDLKNISTHDMRLYTMNVGFVKWIQPFYHRKNKQATSIWFYLYQTIVIYNTITHNNFTFYRKARSDAKRKGSPMQPALFVSSRNSSGDFKNIRHWKIRCMLKWYAIIYSEYRIRQMSTTLLTEQKQTSNQYMILPLSNDCNL